MDWGTMPVARSDIRRTSLLRKFLSHEATARDNLHRSLYGLPGFQVLTVTTSEKRVARCREILLEVARDGGDAKRFLFASKDVIAYVEETVHTRSYRNGLEKGHSESALRTQSWPSAKRGDRPEGHATLTHLRGR